MVIVFGACRGTREVADDPSAGSAQQPTPIARSERRAAEAAQPSGYIGVLAPRGTAEVPAPFASRKVELLVKLGDAVTKGQPIARLDDRAIREQLAIAKAALQSHQAQVQQASVEQHAAQAKLDREKAGLGHGVSSPADVTAATYELSRAGTMVARALADVEEQKARIAQLEKQLGDATVVAPIEGKVALRYVEDGARVTEGQAMVRVISSDELFVKFAIPASDAKKLASGDAIDVKIDTRDGKVEGVVRDVAPELDPVAQMILAEAELKHPPADLQAGLVCRISKAIGR
jgi:RND family efflux transporter MFP subunit